MTCMGDCPIEAPKDLFPQGVGVLMECNPGAKRWMFLVFPTLVRLKHTSVLVANHFSFVIEKSDKNKSCHFHSTIYSPLAVPNNDANMQKWAREPTTDYFPSEMQLPRYTCEGTDAIIRKDGHKKYKPFLLDFLRHPWIIGQVGGSKRKPKPTVERLKARPIMSTAFADMWSDNWISRMVAVGVKTSAKTRQWSVSVMYHGERKISSIPSLAYVFELPLAANEAEFQEAMVWHMR